MEWVDIPTINIH